MTIGELAARFGLATHVLRHWEAMGLLAPERQPNGRRRYQREHAGQVGLILLGKDAGFSLSQLRALLTNQDDPTVWRQLLTEQQKLLRQRISDSQASLAIISQALDCDHPDLTECTELVNSVNNTAGEPAHSPTFRGSDGSN
ncbi:MerR family transcriptional regulator [Verrucosispora sp. WMMD573]|uniref:MerR family transcriptional regulator n=1 Tax=Verrucosispora sp. WMMD573 TaxID=3015149 RepID=UPI00248B98EF|nr:MerR family transcriptional regulator [Verrucosispora sp. WMMD573]WBB57246.1 MerR family transcriptional regulator [Verrucosispora sp. WMMD573]